MPNQIAMSLMAHPDDAEMLCVGTLLRLREAGWEVHIATVTPGDCGTTSETPWRIAAIRTDEAARSAGLMGAVYHCLDERDGFVVYDKPTLRKVIDLLRRVAPGVVFTHAPRDYMLDHEMTSQLARAATFVHGAPNVSAFPVKEGTAIPHLYYADPVEGIDPFGRLVEPTTYVETTSQMEKKSEMLGCHASQREWLRAHHGMDEYVESMKRHSRFRGGEVGADAAEAFVQHRGHAYPRNDLLRELLG